MVAGVVQKAACTSETLEPSQAAHNRIAAAQRARWAKTRAQQKKPAIGMMVCIPY